ncbi:hypothetical protein ACTMS2_12510 [Micromonospora sp. SD12]|uniref:hypothetical protein n=1 Tax=Micromonospora sp. SD12 TaxID=3452216 RepID=UPI003F8A13A3
MPSAARVPPRLAVLPFRASTAIADGLLTWTMLRGPSWRRFLPDVHVHRDGYRADDHRMWCDAVALALPIGGRSPAAAPRTCGASTCWPGTRRSPSCCRAPHGCASTRVSG